MNILILNQAFEPNAVVLGTSDKIIFSVIYFTSEDEPNNNLFITSKMLQLQKINKEEINAIAVVNGPGSFTGTRVGVVDAKIIAYTLNIHLYNVNSLDLIAAHFTKDNFTVLLPAYRKEFFMAIYKEGKRISKDEIVGLNNLKSIEGAVVSVEDSIGSLFKDFIKVNLNPEVMLRLIFENINESLPLKDPLSLAPIYLHATDVLFKKTKNG